MRTPMSMSLVQATAELTAAGALFELAPCVVDGVPLRCWKNVPPTLRDLVLQSRRCGDLTYLVYEDERSSYEQTFQRVVALARSLAIDLGLRKGERVAIAMRNHPEWVIGFWATTALGAIAVPLNAWWTGEELAYALEDS